MTKILQTEDLTQFKRIKGNRIVDANHVTWLSLSVNERNLLDKLPIIVNEQLEVIDGQHRLAVAQKFSMPISYIIIEGASFEDIKRLNSYSRPWKFIDYLNSYIELGKKDYIVLKKFSDDFGMNLSIARFILGWDKNSIGERDHGLVQEFRNGNFKVKDLGLATEIARGLVDTKHFLDEYRVFTDRDFVRAAVRAFDELSTAQVINILKKSDKKVIHSSKFQGYIKQLEDIIFTVTGNRIRLT